MRRRICLLRMALAALLAWSAPALAAKHPEAQGPDITGVYWLQSYSPRLTPLEGGPLPYRPEFQAQYERNQAAVADNTLNDPARRLCVPDGVPRVLQSPYPFEIVQTPGQVHFLYEINHVIRLVRMNQELPSEEELAYLPAYSGHSVGHWEGDTLVVTTAGFKPGLLDAMETQITYLDNSGAPHSHQLRTVERYRMIGAGTLEAVVTIEDPQVFTAPFQARFLYDKRPGVRIMDYVCGQPHRDISHIPGVQLRE